MKYLKHLFLAITFLAHNTISTPAPKKVVIVLPMAHQALDAIVSGFSKRLIELMPGQVTIRVENAMGDSNVQQTILKKLNQQAVDLVVPVSKQTTLMAVQHIKDRKIVSLAAMYSEEYRKQAGITGVLDELPIQKLLHFFRAVVPHLSHLTLVCSGTDKVQKEAQEAVMVAGQMGIELKVLTIHTLSDLYALSKQIGRNKGPVFILKDHMVASGIAGLLRAASCEKKLVFSSDEGTVSEGVPIGLGVVEFDIGVEGAYLAQRVLMGEKVDTIPIKRIAKAHVFVNAPALKGMGIDLSAIQRVAKTLGYTVKVKGAK